MPPKKQEGAASATTGGETPTAPLGTVTTPAPAPLDPRDQQIADLSTRLRALERGEGPKPPKRVNQHEAKVMFVEDLEGKKGAVVRFGEVKVIGEGKEEKMMIEIDVVDAVEGKVTTKTVDYLRMLNEAPRYTVRINKQNATAFDLPQGGHPKFTALKPADPIGMREAGKHWEQREIVLEHHVVKYVAEIEFIEGPWKGQEMKIESEALNP